MEHKERLEEFRQWRELEVTKDFFRHLSEQREGLRDDWENATISATFTNEHIAKQAGAAAVAHFIKELTDMKGEDLYAE